MLELGALPLMWRSKLCGSLETDRTARPSMTALSDRSLFGSVGGAHHNARATAQPLV